MPLRHLPRPPKLMTTNDLLRPALGLFPGADTPRLYDATVGVMKARHLSPKTQKAYLGWIRRFIEFHKGRHPRDLREPQVNAFLTYLAVERKVAGPTQNQALAAILFLHEHVLKEPLDRIEGVIRAAKPKRLPVALTRPEVELMFSLMTGVPLLVCELIYGSGLRVREALSLRVKDLNFATSEIVVRGGKGDKDRVTILPQSLRPKLERHLAWVRRQHERDLARGRGRVPMPHALGRKYPSADREWSWQWVFPATRHFTDPETGVQHRWSSDPSNVQKAVKAAWRKSGLTLHVSTHTFRHSFATQLLRDGYDIRTVQELMGHKSIKTTEIYLHVLNRGSFGVISPLDGPPPRISWPPPPNPHQPCDPAFSTGAEAYADQDD